MDGCTTKICTRCKVEQHVYFFSFSSRTMAYSSYCLQCMADTTKSKHFSKPVDETATKFCIGCGENKPLSEYSFKRDRGKHATKCIACMRKPKRESEMKRLYGVDFAWQEKTLMLQDNRCAICNIPFDEENFKPHIDHNASNKKVRALLCSPCNVLIGMHRENCATLRQAGFDRHAKYLEHYKRIHEIKLVG